MAVNHAVINICFKVNKSLDVNMSGEMGTVHKLGHLKNNVFDLLGRWLLLSLNSFDTE